MSDTEQTTNENVQYAHTGGLWQPSTTAPAPTTIVAGGTLPVVQELHSHKAPMPEDHRSDGQVIGQLISMAGRPWCMKPEALEVLVSALSAGITAGDLLELPEKPKVTKRVGIAIIPLAGMLTPHSAGLMGAILGMGTGLSDFRANLGEAMADDEVKAIVLDVNSPGGLVDHVPETAAMVRAAREHKPITAVASTQAASAAYWIASQANDLVVTPSGEVGSIGCYMLHTDKSEHLAKEGLNVTVTSAGKYKTEANQYEPLSDSAKEAQQRKVDRFYGQFVKDVAAGRGVTEDEVRGGYGEGRTLLADDAVEQGLADRVTTLDNAVVEVAQTAVQAAQHQVTSLEAARDHVTLTLS